MGADIAVDGDGGVDDDVIGIMRRNRRKIIAKPSLPGIECEEVSILQHFHRIKLMQIHLTQRFVIMDLGLDLFCEAPENGRKLCKTRGSFPTTRCQSSVWGIRNRDCFELFYMTEKIELVKNSLKYCILVSVYY
jgi:hypothetical protein